ncbi:hypothetical protein [Pseudonocardia sp. GCM10023141]|uniref:hypothetical protein n=1 Tax=Pseudonocardia sp. GCM10023141 TaxID=3252653 RepID=UPI00360785B5
MTDPNGFRTAPEALTEAALGIQDALAELGEVGTVGMAAAGRGITQLALDEATLGDAAVVGAFNGFCERWDWGVRGLVQAGQKIVDGLNDSGVAYLQAENGAAGLMKRALFDLSGNPMGDSAAASTLNWEDALTTGPDYSAQSFADAGDHIGSTWSSTVADAGNAAVPGMISRALNGENPLQPMVDDIHGLAEIGD